MDLPAPCAAAAATDDTVWCAAGGWLLAFDGAGARRLNQPLAGVRALGASGTRLAAALDDGVVTWLDPRTGREIGRRSVGAGATLVAGGGAVWAIDGVTGRGWRLGEPPDLVGPVAMPGVDRAAADGERVWWLSRHDTRLRDGTREVELDLGHEERGGLTVCANSVWLSLPRGLARVGTWGAARGPLVEAAGPLPFLTCGGGVLVGASSRDGLFVLDPLGDAGVRRLSAEPGELGCLVATRDVAWMCSKRDATARLVPIRAG